MAVQFARVRVREHAANISSRVPHRGRSAAGSSICDMESFGSNEGSVQSWLFPCSTRRCQPVHRAERERGRANSSGTLLDLISISRTEAINQKAVEECRSRIAGGYV